MLRGRQIFSKLLVMVVFVGVMAAGGRIYLVSPSALAAPIQTETVLIPGDEQKQQGSMEELLNELEPLQNPAKNTDNESSLKKNPAQVEQILAELQKLVPQLEVDRRLLAELRKQIPPVRKEAESYLERIKELAAKSDPTQLVPLVNKVMDRTSTFYDWVEEEFETPEERAMAYYMGGAREFRDAFEELKNAILLTVINRLDVIASLVE
ncbi:hypothetical protein IBX65_06330 [Candidatus Aerophobetes bacterium]|nr:hypothetical protein [Candidatus Aerophobetes bacterium]